MTSEGLTCAQVGVVRIHIVGILTLHTLSSREMLTTVLSVQTLFGSIAIAAGGFIGYVVGLGPASVYADISIAGACEVLRFVFTGLLLWHHHVEHVALP